MKEDSAFQYHHIDFSQPFLPLNLEKELYPVHRFKVYHYFPAKIYKNVEYYFLSNSLHEDTKTETALFGICWFRYPNRNEVELFFTHKMLVIGDHELWQYINRIFLKMLISRKEEELKKRGSNWVVKNIDCEI